MPRFRRIDGRLPVSRGATTTEPGATGLKPAAGRNEKEVLLHRPVPSVRQVTQYPSDLEQQATFCGLVEPRAVCASLSSRHCDNRLDAVPLLTLRADAGLAGTATAISNVSEATFARDRCFMAILQLGLKKDVWARVNAQTRAK